MGWLKDFWDTGEPIRKGISVSLSGNTLVGEEQYVKAGYLAARENNYRNPYIGKKATWWQRGQDNYHNGPFT